MSCPSVLYLVTEPWYFVNHRLDHAKALVAAGFEVHVATRQGDRWNEIEGAGCVAHEIDIARGGAGVRATLGEIRACRRLVRAVRPDVVHAVALKPLALSLTLIPMRRRPSLVLSVNGLGLSAIHSRWRTRMISGVVRVANRLPRVHLLFQTQADQSAVLARSSRGAVIPGVGVDVDRFRPVDRQPTTPFSVVYLGRAVRSKGLMELAATMRAHPVRDVELHLYCAVDATSPGALSAAELDAVSATPGVVVHQSTAHPEVVLAHADGAILPSLAGEGVSKFVLEALACGTPVILSRASGSGEVVRPGQTGLEFDWAEPVTLTNALEEMASWTPDKRRIVSAACRSAAEGEYSLDRILPLIVDLHRRAIEAIT